jgi:hypothetical protein
MDRVENTVHCCTVIVSVGTCLLAKALLSNGYVYLLIRNLLPSSGCFVVTRYNVIEYCLKFATDSRFYPNRCHEFCGKNVITLITKCLKL